MSRHAGSTGNQAFYGGPGIIGASCVNVVGTEASVYVHGGFCQSANAAPRELAMRNVTKVTDVRHFSPVGKLPTPFSSLSVNPPSPSGILFPPFPDETNTNYAGIIID